MKKRTMAFGGLLVAVAMTAYSVSGTYAKYISQVDLTDEARVAKWGFNEDIEFDLFKTSYVNNGKTYVKALDAATDNVVAPGTTGTKSVNLTGTMETRFTLAFELVNENDFVVYYSVDADGNVDKMNTTKEGLMDDGVAETDVKEYRPLRYSIKYTKADGTEVFKAENIDINTVKAGLEQYNANNAKPDLSHTFDPQVLNRNIEITWAWDTNNTTDNTVDKNVLDEDNSNKLDTFAGKNLSNKSIQFGIKVTAEQVAEDYAK